MSTRDTQSLKPNGNGQGKNKDYQIQLAIVYKAFKVKPMTMLEADAFTGIMRSNICWHLGDLKELGKVFLLRKRKCTITGCLAGEYTTDPELIPKSNQLKMF